MPGINIIENDEAGVQLSIATRGLNPNRTTEFNARQNGYDISADPIGYPETYYSPVSDALERIEIIRGAASLQYGTQFGGLLNFRFKEGAKNKPFELLARQTGGSYGFFNSFNSIGGQLGKLNYYGFYNFKRGDGWRTNTGFHTHNGYLALKYQASRRLSIGLEHTFMSYTMQQPGGLTDRAFAADPRQSLRNRNWFAATWNIPALTLEYQMSTSSLLSVKMYALFANRKNVGDLAPITIPDDASSPRTVMNDAYRNLYTEARFIHHYRLRDSLQSSFLAGVRFYRGATHRVQGYNYTGSDANFSIGTAAMQIDYRFPSYNAAAFAENSFQLTRRFSVTPGVRFEYIQTNGVGYTRPDTTTNTRLSGDERHERSFPLLGIGLEYLVSQKTDAYANISQNYSPVNFGDIVVVQPNMRVDPALKDVHGYNADVGYRGTVGGFLHFDVSMFYMLYQNRIGSLLQIDSAANVYQYQTNISDSRSLGLESYVDVSLSQLLRLPARSHTTLSVFGSAAYTDARYIHTDPPQRRQFKDKKVEYAAPWIYRLGVDGGWKKLRASLQYAYTAAEYADATNAVNSTNGAVGIIPAYRVLDVTASYTAKKWMVSGSVNNLADEKYFTRRTTGFPGPGIIPSAGRTFYLTVQWKIL